MSRDRREDPGQYYPGGSVIPKTPTPSGGVGGDGDVRHVDFADIDIKEDMTLNEVGSMVNTLVRKLKGPALLLLSACCFSSLAAITPDTDFGDISPTNKIGEVVADSGAVMTETDPTVPPWAKQPNPPEGMTDNAIVFTNGAVKTVNGLKTIGAADIGALSTNGGFVAGNITIKDNTAIRFKTYEPDFDAEIRLGDAHSAMVLDALTAFYLNTKTTLGYEGIYFNGRKVALENWESLYRAFEATTTNITHLTSVGSKIMAIIDQPMTTKINQSVSARLNTYIDGETGVEYEGKMYEGSLYYVPTGNVYPTNN